MDDVVDAIDDGDTDQEEAPVKGKSKSYGMLCNCFRIDSCIYKILLFNVHMCK